MLQEFDSQWSFCKLSIKIMGKFTLTFDFFYIGYYIDVLSPILESAVKDLDKKELCHSSNRLEGKSKCQFHKPLNTEDQNFLFTT